MSGWRTIPIDETALSPRAKNALRNAGYYSLGDVAAARESELLRCPNLGRVTLSEVEAYVSDDFGAVIGEQRFNLTKLRAQMLERVEILQRDLESIERKLEK